MYNFTNQNEIYRSKYYKYNSINSTSSKDYFSLYKKYKNKYLNLKNMIGGNKPSTIILKNINLLSGLEKEYLDPTIGYIWSLNATKNYYLFGRNQSRITQLVQLLYLNASIDFIYTKTILERNVTPFQLGYLLGKWYNYYFNLPLLESIVNKYKSNNKNFKSEEINILNAIKNNLNREERRRSKIKDDQNEKIIQKYKNNEYLKDFCNMEAVADKIRKEKYIPKYLNNIQEIKLEQIESYYKMILDNSKKKDKIISGEYFRQHFNKVFNHKTFDSIKKTIEQSNQQINSNSTLSDYAKMVKEEIEIELQGIFAVALSFLWNIANDKNGIKEYYRGLYQHIYNPEIEELLADQKPEFFDNYNINELKFKKDNQYSFNQLLSIFKNKVKGALSFQGTENLGGWGDCVETSIKNFIKILIFNQSTRSFDLQKLKDLGANETSDIYLFFEKFNKDSDHSSNSVADFNGEKLNVRKAWAKIMNGIPNVRYSKGSYEIKPGNSKDDKKNNIEAVLEHLFNIKTFSELENKVPGLKIKMNDKFNIEVNYKDNLYKWISEGDEHMDFKILVSKNKFDIKKALKVVSPILTEFQQKILYYHDINHIENDGKRLNGFKTIYNDFKNFYFFSINRASLKFIINSLFPLQEFNYSKNTIQHNLIMDKDFYNKVYQIVKKEATPDQKRSMYLNFTNLNDINLEDNFKNYITSYNKEDQSLNLKIRPSNGTILKLGNSLQKLKDLKKIEIYSVEPVDVENSFENLDKLETIIFTSTYPINLYSEIHKLKSIKTIKLNPPYSDDEKELVDKLKLYRGLNVNTSDY